MKNKIKIILFLIITTIITNGITAYATYNYLAKDITYTKEDGTNVSVQEALNEVYSNKKQNEDKFISSDSKEYRNGTSSTYSSTFDIPNGATKAVIIANGGSMWGAFTNLDVDANNIISKEEYKLSYELIDGHWAGRGVYTIVMLNGESGELNTKITINNNSTSKSSATIDIFFYK